MKRFRHAVAKSVKKGRSAKALSSKSISRSSFSKKHLIFFAVLFATIGSYAIYSAFAATPRFQYRFMTNSSPDQAAVAGYGFNLLDVGSAAEADALPSGTQGQIWVGDYDNTTCNWQMPDATVTSIVTAAVGDPKVAGYFFSDEPDPFACPSAYAQHAARNNLIKSLDPGHYTLMLVDSNSAQQTLDQIPNWVGKADHIALDPYPCYANNPVCDYSWIDTVIAKADSVGMDYWGEAQAFTGGQWRWPTSSELDHMLNQWSASNATGYMAFAWTWQGTRLDSQPGLLSVMQSFNGGTTPPPADSTPPTVSLTAPANGATLVGNATVSANAADNVAVGGVQFKLDGNNLQAEDTSAPYSITWPTAGTTNGSHTLSAVARDTSGNLSTISSVSVTVNNPAPPPGTTYVITAAGDVCSSGTDPDDCKSTANLINQINPDAVLTLGDNAYNDGSPSDFASEYAPNWGQFLNKTYPAPGNHDYHTSGASGYFGYFGSRAPAEFYSYNLGNWHLISLPGDEGPAGGYGLGSAQEVWLKNDLAAHPNMCTIAYWHEPRWSSGDVHGNDTDFDQIMKDLYASHADLVLTGHDHFYERFAPQNPQSQADPANGLTEFVVGTGGSPISGYGFVSPLVANSVVHNNQVKGVLKLTLRSGSYDYQFMPTPGYSFTDSGSGTCHNSGVAPPADTTAPTVNMTAPADSATLTSSPVTVSASASDNVGVYGVQFKLNGSNLGAEDTTSPYTVSWNTSTIANGTYTLSAVARDAAGNLSTESTITVTVNNPPPPAPDTTPPTTPANLRSSASTANSITVAWDASTDSGGSGLAGYKLYRGGTLIATIPVGGGLSYTDSGRSASTGYSYTIAAYDNAGNNSAQSAAVNISTTANPPTVTISAAPTSIVANNASTLTWSSTNATSCTASGAWSGAKTTSGSQSTGNLSATSTFTLSCSGTGGSATNSTTVTVTAPPPTINLSASPNSISSGSASTLTWSTTDATTCTASGAWSGAKATSGSQSTGNLSATSTFNLSCSGPGGTTATSAAISVNAPPPAPAPSVSLSVSPTNIANGSSSTLTWSSTNATSCTASGAWSGAKATSGSQSTGSLTGNSNFSLSCTGSGGTASGSVSVTVAAAPAPAPTYKKGDINHDGSVNVFDLSILLSNYSSSNAAADIDANGTVNVFDLSILLSHYGE